MNQRALVGLFFFALLSVACSTGGTSTGDGVRVSDDTAEELETDQGSSSTASREEAVQRPEIGHYWGQIQSRADRAYAAMEAELRDCLETLGGAQDVREFALHARRDGPAGQPYELAAVVTHPPDVVEQQSCVEDLAQQFVERVGSALWDDFDTYIATFVHRGEEPPGCEGDSSHTLCADLGMPGQAVLDDKAAAQECPETLVAAARQALQGGQQCWRASRLQERLQGQEDQPIEHRMVIFGGVEVEQGQARVALRYNQPWVEPVLQCAMEDFGQATVAPEDLERPCASRLRNLAVTYWHRPTFTYLVDGGESQSP